MRSSPHASRGRIALLKAALLVGTAAAGGAGLAPPPAVAAPARPAVPSIAVPGGEAGVGYDDLQYAPELNRILAPAGRTGQLIVIDPATAKATAVPGFSATDSYRGGHGEGTTSAVELGGGFIVATDRGTKTLKVVSAKADRKTSSIVSSLPLAGGPDYVRRVAPTNEVWVTEPGRKRIEVLAVIAPPPGATGPGLAHAAEIAVPDGPESLVVDARRGRAYTHAWKEETYAIDLKARKVVASWRNGCRKSRGIALDEARGLLFTGCGEGGVTVVDLASAKVVSSAPTGPDVDSIGYAPLTGHLYVPSGGSGELSVFAVSAGGKLQAIGRVPTAADAHTVAFHPATGTVFVGTPAHGSILVIHDDFAAAAR